LFRSSAVEKQFLTAIEMRDYTRAVF
jgi:hypothetical protein